KTFLPALAILRHTCRSSVDFPIPGSPPTSDRDPVTIPPPRTRSSSRIPVEIRSSSCMVIWDIFIGESEVFPAFAPPLRLAGAAFSSTNVFHCLQAGHCPIHLEDS